MCSSKIQNPNSQAPAITAEQKAEEEKVRSQWLNRTVKIVMTDERELVGKIVCIDGYGNLILQEVVETRTKMLKNGKPVVKAVVHRNAIAPPKAIKNISIAKTEPVRNTTTPPPAGAKVANGKSQG